MLRPMIATLWTCRHLFILAIRIALLAEMMCGRNPYSLGHNRPLCCYGVVVCGQVWWVGEIGRAHV